MAVPTDGEAAGVDGVLVRGGAGSDRSRSSSLLRQCRAAARTGQGASRFRQGLYPKETWGLTIDPLKIYLILEFL